MENVAIDSKTKFLEWLCEDYERMIENKIQRAMFLGLLSNNSKAILEMVAHGISNQIDRYKVGTNDGEFNPDPNEINQLCGDALKALKKRFLPPSRA